MDSSHNPKLSLARSAWLIIVFSSAMGIIFSLILGTLCFDIERVMKREAEIGNRIAMVTRSVQEGSEYLHRALFWIGHQTKLEQPWEAYQPTAMLKRLLRESAEDDPLLHKNLLTVTKAERGFREGFRLWSSWPEAKDPIEAAKRADEGAKQTADSFKKSTSAIFATYQGLEQEAVETEHEIDVKANQAMVIVPVLFLFNLATSLLFAFLFSKRVAQRMSVLKNSANCLAAGQTVTESLDGDDEIKRLELRLVELSSELEQAQRRKQDFLSMVGHDLRSPLTSIGLTLDMFQQGVYCEVSQEFGQELNKQTGRVQLLITFISDLLDLEKIESGNFVIEKSVHELNGIIKQVKDDVTKLALREAKILEFSLEGDVLVDCDRDRLVQALQRVMTAFVYETLSPIRVKVDASNSTTVVVSIESPIRSLHILAPDVVFNRFAVRDESKSLFANHRHSLSLSRKLIRMQGGELECLRLPGVARFQLSLRKAKEGR